jgi:hypothetical protein
MRDYFEVGRRKLLTVHSLQKITQFLIDDEEYRFVQRKRD